MSEGSGVSADAPVAVVGAGFSGTMVALHLAETLPPGRQVLLCEAESFACGMAYGTGNPSHLLNVRAANMSAFPDRPAHFAEWLETVRWECPEQIRATDAGEFASRGLFRRYLCSLLDRAVAGAPERLRKIPAEIVDMAQEGDVFVLRTSDGTAHAASAVVLAIGNLPPPDGEHALYRTNPWAPGVTKGLRPGLPVLIRGTGLTMVDLALDLRDGGFEGPVIALSRRGLLPQRHAPTRPWPTPDLDDAERGSMPLLLARLRWEVQRAAARGVDWRGVVDSLRPVTADIWGRLSPAERGRFLRHVRPYWDIHRHRLSAPVADQVQAMLDSGFLQVRRGRLAGMEFGHDTVEARIQPHGADDVETLTVQRVIGATGVPSAAEAASPLVQALCGRGLARLDARAFGLDVTETLAVRDATGQPTPCLWALGPIVRGVFWECVAVPDVRVQARRVADAIVGRTVPAG